MKKIAIAIHGGASESTSFLKKHLKETEVGLKEAIQKAYKVLQKGGSALDAVELAVANLEDNYLFNAGRGSALNSHGEVEMDAAIMDGKNIKAGAVSMVHTVKNPIILARKIMQKTKHVFLSGYGAIEFAKKVGIDFETENYFITEDQRANFLKRTKKKTYGTVGAVALDSKGNIAAGTSTGGIQHCLPGRVGDSCIIGAGCYANNNTCAVSATGDGEVIITNVIAHTISMYVDLKKYPLQKACDYVIKKMKRPVIGGIGVISVNKKGQFGMSFNTEVMKRAWIDPQGNMQIKIY